MKTITKKVTYRKFFLSLAIAGIMISCSSDDDGGGDNGGGENPNAPTLSITGDSTVFIKPGETVSVTVTLNAPGGNQQLLVYANDGILEEVALDNDITTFTYTNQTIPEGAEEGTIFEYEFALEDDANQVSTRAAFTANVAVYDPVDIDGQSLFNIDIPENGIVPDGKNIILSADRDYYLSESLSFTNGSSLTIREGATIYVKTPVEVTDPTLSISMVSGAGLSIIGTATNPVVITPSSSIAGTAEPGDWNRLFLDGSSGSLTGVIIQYFRSEYATDGLRADNMDDTNTFEYIQSYKSGGEGIYFTNGNVNAKYIVATNSKAEGFRFGDSYSGNVQFGLAIMSERIDLEDDSYEVVIRDQSSAKLANFTAVGPGQDTEDEDVYAYRLRGTGNGRVYNSIAASFFRRGVRVSDDPAGGTLAGPKVFAYGYVFDLNSQHFRDNPFGGSREVSGTILNPFFNNVTSYEEVDDGMGGTEFVPIYDKIAGIGTNDFIPDATVTAKENHDPSTVDAFFTSVTFVGAVENAENDWTVGWVKNPDGTIR